MINKGPKLLSYFKVNQNEKIVIVKADIPTSLKLQFKVLCIQRKLTMSQALEQLIRNWIQANTPVSDFISEFSEEDYQIIKGYIPESLKTQFKVSCTQKRVTMSSALYNLINIWVMAETNQ